MKKLLALLLVLAMTFSLSGCALFLARTKNKAEELQEEIENFAEEMEDEYEDELEDGFQEFNEENINDFISESF